MINKLTNLMESNKYIIAVVLGMLVTLSFAPFYLFPMILLSFSGALYLLDIAETKKEAFYLGLWFGFGKFASGLYWFSNALLLDGIKFAWVIPFANIALPLALGIYPALSFLLTYILTKNSPRFEKILVFSSNWVLFEYLRSILFTGFPWNLMGYSFSFSSELSQLASVIGVYGLSFFAVYLASSLYIQKESLIILNIIFLAFCYAYGSLRLKSNADFHDVSLYLVQGNIAQNNKWDENLRLENLKSFINLSMNASNDSYVIWPESAIPYNIEDQDLRRFISQIIPENGLLITGSVRMREENNQERWWNSISFINNQGEIIQNYNKSHLVPFGEYIPFRKFMPKSLKRLTYGMGDFEVGSGAVTLNLDKELPKFAPSICYEIIFSNAIIDRENRPDWILNVTNDGWFGNTIGPYQHFEMSRYRAIEEGLPLIRAANTGISAIIDGKGRVISSIDLEKQGVINGKLPKAEELTIFSKFQNKPVFIICLCIYIYIFCRRYIYKYKFA